MTRPSLAERGFTVIEAIVTLAVFGGVLGILTLGYFKSVTVFQSGTVRHSMQTDFRKIYRHFQRDVKLTNGHLLNLVDRPDSGAQRDAISLVALSDWENNSLFDPVTQFPIWDTYVVYFASLGESGELLRAKVEPSSFPPSGLNQPFLDTSLLANTVASSGFTGLTSLKVLGKSVTNFDVSLEPSRRVRVQIKFDRSDSGQGGTRRKQSLESEISVMPKNTWPEI